MINEGSFEVITVSEAALQSIRGRSTSSSNRRINSMSNAKHGISFQKRILISLVVLASMVVGVASLFGVFTSEHDLQELRLEFKKDIESLRSEVEHDLVPQLLATAEKQQNKKNLESIVDGQTNLLSLDSEHAANPSSSVSLEATAQPYDIYDILVDSSICVRDAIHYQLKSILETILSKAWIRFPKLMSTLEFANEHRWGFATVYAILGWVVYRLYFKFGTDSKNGKATKKKNRSSKTPRKNKTTDDSSENASDDDDDVMNRMLHDAMATAGRPIAAQPIYISTNGRMSKEEKRRRARENASKFGARDKQRLERRGAPAPAPARAAPAPAPARVYNLANRRAPEPARADIASPKLSKKERIKQARARAKEFAEHDKEQMRNAVERRNRNY